MDLLAEHIGGWAGEWVFPSMMLLMFVGVSQVFYVWPAVLIARSRGRYGLARGLELGAALIFLLNATCFGFAAPAGGG